MVDKKGGYRLPSNTAAVSCSWQCHKDRRPSSTEPGTDYATPYGSTLYAPEDGTVFDVHNSTAGGTGRYIAINFNDGNRGRALHLSQIFVKAGQKVKRGQEIGKTGASGWGREWGYGAHVHQTLWEFQGPVSYLGPNTVDFARRVGADNDNIVPASSQKTKDIQNSINRYRKAAGLKIDPLIVDGIPGPRTTAAIKAVQVFLKTKRLYDGAIDGIWGPKTNSGWNTWAKSTTQAGKPPALKYHTATVKDAASLGSGNAVKGLQKIARLYLPQKVDGLWGKNSNTGLQRFLDQNYGGSLAAWLRAKWGYVGNDQWGPQMKAALQRANAANLKSL